MIVKTQAIIISSLKYGDTSRILKCYTREEGIQSLIAKGVYARRNRTNPMLSPLNMVELIYDNKGKSTLKIMKECRMQVHYVSIDNNQYKTAIALFLSEILNMVLREEEANPDLYDFVSSSLSFFDRKEEAYSDFHLWFLLQLSRYLGFYPQIKPGAAYFDLINGVSAREIPTGVYAETERMKLLEILSELNFFEQVTNRFNQSQRKMLLELLLKYYEIHLYDFRWPKSLEVLNVVFE